MTLQERVEAYKAAFPTWPASWPWVGQERGHDVIYAIWVIGNDYRNPSPSFYGAYPKGYIARVRSLFPDLVAKTPVLHAFSGSIRKSKHYDRCDLKGRAEYQCNVYDLPKKVGGPKYGLVLADPPYSAQDAKQYGTPGVNRGVATRALAAVTLPGGYLAWLDTTWPMHTKELWTTVGRIYIQRSTNHRVRVLSILERTNEVYSMWW